MINPNSTILFQGDSITDAGRNREISAPNVGAALGAGYVNLIAARLLQARPQDKLCILNRGISGNRVTDLYARWKVDGINLQPDLISILIGVNDTWHEFMYGNGVEVDRYTTVYRMVLEYTKQRLPAVQLVLCEPFVLHCGVVTEGWIAEMRERRQIVRQLATEFDAIFVPFQSMFDTALAQAEPAYWAADGVHPTPAGHRLMADTWLAAVAGIAG